MKRGLIVLVGAALVGCGQQAATGNNAAVTANVVAPAEDDCSVPALSLADGAPLQTELLNEVTANFTNAFRRSCANGTLEGRELIDPKAADQGKLFLINAPDSNVASIYLSEVDGNRMVLEYAFLTADGKSQVPSAAELEEAIHCAVVGATPEEQEKSGRCLVD